MDNQAEQLDLTRPDAYGRAFVDVYDRWYAPTAGTDDATVLETMAAFVAARCPSGVVIELGVGSGRLAEPLIGAGLRVIGLDASPSMIRRCPPEVLRVVGDMAHPPFRSPPAARPDDGAPAPTVLCGFNTLFNLGSAARLDDLLASVAALGSTFIVETMNTDLLSNQRIRSTDVAPHAIQGGVVVSATDSDPSRHRLTGRHLEITDHGVVSRPWLLRLISRHELDARAVDHGLELNERHRSWRAEPFRGVDPVSISVYRPSPPGRATDMVERWPTSTYE